MLLGDWVSFTLGEVLVGGGRAGMGGEINPFFAGGAIADRRYFVGRSPELREIFSKMFAD